jgi:hypothetical protein
MISLLGNNAKNKILNEYNMDKTAPKILEILKKKR